jgi:hypothetical protein
MPIMTPARHSTNSIVPPKFSGASLISSCIGLGEIFATDYTDLHGHS